MIKLDPQIRSTLIDGHVESVYLVFRDEVPAKETIPFSRPNGAELLIDVDGQDIPIAVQFIESVTPAELGDARVAATAQQSAHVVSLLFAFANQMVAYHRANQQARGNALIEDAVERIRYLSAPGIVTTS